MPYVLIVIRDYLPEHEIHTTNLKELMLHNFKGKASSVIKVEKIESPDKERAIFSVLSQWKDLKFDNYWSLEDHLLEISKIRSIFF